MVHRLALNALVSVLLCGIAGAADEFPDELIGFLKPGMKIGIDSFPKNSDDIEIHVWTDDRFALELDAGRMDFEELMRKYPAVSKARDELLGKTADGVKAIRGLSLEPCWISQYTPMTVTHVGTNYLLLQLAENKEVRIAIPANRVSAIRWGMNQLTLGQSPSRTIKD